MKVFIDGEEYVRKPETPKGDRFLEALDVRFDSDAGENLTVREYLMALLEKLWEQGEGFSGKRPFGNSGWDYEIYKPLVAAGFISGQLDEDGFIVDIGNEDLAASFVFDLIRAAFFGVRK